MSSLILLVPLVVIFLTLAGFVHFYLERHQSKNASVPEPSTKPTLCNNAMGLKKPQPAQPSFEALTDFEDVVSFSLLFKKIFEQQIAKTSTITSRRSVLIQLRQDYEYILGQLNEKKFAFNTILDVSGSYYYNEPTAHCLYTKDDSDSDSFRYSFIKTLAGAFSLFPKSAFTKGTFQDYPVSDTSMSLLKDLIAEASGSSNPFNDEYCTGMLIYYHTLILSIKHVISNQRNPLKQDLIVESDYLLSLEKVLNLIPESPKVTSIILPKNGINISEPTAQACAKVFKQFLREYK